MKNEYSSGEKEVEEHPSPPVIPAADERIDSDPDFAAECRASARDLPSSERWILTTELLTRSDRWGQIWRADFVFDDQSFHPQVNRLLVWRHADGSLPVVVAVGQLVAPLKSLIA